MILTNLMKNRTHRSFTKKKVTHEELLKIVEGARFSATSANAQRVRFFLVDDSNMCDKIFGVVKFAGAIAWNPTIDESPRGYIAICGKDPLVGTSEELFGFDMGLCSQNMLLVANELGLAGCLIGAYDRAAFDKLVNMPAGYKSHYLLALGEPKDSVTVVEPKEGNITYYRDENNHHYVPKLSVNDLIIK